MKEPIRMRESHELPSALRDAFATLGQGAPGPETVLRVQRALEALPATAPATTAVGTLGLGKLFVVATLLAGALTSIVMLRSRNEDQHAAQGASGTIDSAPLRSPTSPQSGQTTRAQPSLAATSEVHKPASVQEPEVPSLEQVKGNTERVAAVQAPSRPAESTVSSVSIARRLVRADQRAMRGHAAVRPVKQTIADEGPSDAVHDAQTSAAPELPSVAVAQANEAERLAQCKRLAVRDPAEALRQVEALAREVPHGTFVLERELLEIRLHARLGHSATAAQLARLFVERYPNSVYRRALAP